MSAACLVGMERCRPSTPIVIMVVLLAISGVFRSVGFSAYNSVAFSDVPTEKMTHANTLHATLQELGSRAGDRRRRATGPARGTRSRRLSG